MPTPRKTVRPVASEGDPDEFSDAPAGVGVVTMPNSAIAEFADEEESPADRVAAMLGDVRGDDGAIVKVYRTKANGKQGGAVEWCDEMTPAEFEAQGIVGLRDKWGAGEFEIRLYAQHPGTNRYSMRAKQRVTIAAQASPAPVAAASSEFAQALKAMQETQARMLEALTQRPAAVDPMAQLGTMLGIMTQMREAFGGNSKTPISEIVAAVKEMKGIASELGGGEPADPMAAAIPGLIELIGKGIDAQRTPPAASRPIAPMRVPAALAAPARAPVAVPTRPPAAPVASRATPAAPVPAPAPAVGPLGTPLADAPLPGETVIDLTDPQPEAPAVNLPDVNPADPNAAVLLMLESVCEQIDRGDDPADVAEFLFENIPDELVSIVGQRGWLALVTTHVRSVSPSHADALAERAAALEAMAVEFVRIVAEEAAAEDAGNEANPVG